MSIALGIYTDVNGNHIEVPLAVDADGRLLVSGGGGGGGGGGDASAANQTVGNARLTTIASNTAVFALGSAINGVTVAGAVNALAADPGRHYLEFQNASNVEMRLNFGASAGANVGYVVAAGQAWYTQANTTVVGTISVYCAVADKPYAILTA